MFGASLDLLGGTLSESQRSPVPEENRNFKSDVFYGGVNGVFHLDNDRVISRRSPFSPYVSLGFGFLSYTPYGDLKDDNGNEYHYWSDGSIRDRPESENDAGDAEILQRDHEFETDLSQKKDISTSGFSFPVALGFKWKLSDRLEGRVEISYFMTTTDEIDAYKANGDNDQFIHPSVGLQYKFKEKEEESDKISSEQKEVFAEIEASDSDKDGIRDIDDECPQTPQDVEVDTRGCPVDTDGDGVPDYRDEEPNTEEGAMVDKKGVTLTSERLAELKKMRDSVRKERSRVFSESEEDGESSGIEDMNMVSGEGEEDIEEEKGKGKGDEIPEKYKQVDFNNDGKISADEVVKAIDVFFEGKVDLSQDEIYGLIDYYFK